MGDGQATIGRRELVFGGAAAMALSLLPQVAFAQATAAGSSAALRALLLRASRSAFAGLARPDGFWNSGVARINLPVLFARHGAGRGAGPGAAAGPPRTDLQHRLNTIAERAVPRAHATIDRGIARLTLAGAQSAPGRGPTAGTTLLRRATGPRLVNAIIPVLAQALREANDPVIRQAIAGLRGVGTNDVAHALANETDNAIWYAIGASEAAARRGR